MGEMQVQMKEFEKDLTALKSKVDQESRISEERHKEIREDVRHLHARMDDVMKAIMSMASK